METQPGWQLRHEDFRKGFEKFDDLVYYDGPILSHYTAPGGGPPHYLFSCVVQDESYDRWLVLETTIPHLYDYLTNARTLRDIVDQGYNSKLYVADANAEGNFEQVLLVPRTELLSAYLPAEDSYYGLTMADDYATYFNEEAKREVPFARYLAAQRVQPVRFRLAPSDKKHATTVGAADIGGFLQRVTRSFRSYVEVRFEALFRGLYSFEEQAARALTQLLEEAEPRAVNAGFGSFEIDLAVDVITVEGVPAAITDWQRQALLEYQADVISFDFFGQGAIPERLSSANDEQLRAIFGPIVLIANNTSYIAESRVTTTQPFKELKSIAPKDSRRVVPPKPRSPFDEEEETEFANILLQWKKGQDLQNLTPKQLRQALIAVTTGDASIAQITDFTSSEGIVIPLSEPIDVTLSKVGSFTEAYYEPLGIKQLGSNGGTALEAVYRELTRLYAIFRQQVRSEDVAGTSTKQQRISAAFAQLLSQ